MLTITEQRKLIPLLEDICEKKHGEDLPNFLYHAVCEGLDILLEMADAPLPLRGYFTDGAYFIDYRALSSMPDIADWLRCYEQDNKRLASSFHASSLKDERCMRRLAYPLLGYEPQETFRPYTTLTTLVGDWLHQALQDLMLDVPGLVENWIDGESGIELDVKAIRLHPYYQTQREKRMHGLRLDGLLCLDLQRTCLDIKSTEPAKRAKPGRFGWEKDLQGYGYQVLQGAYYTDAEEGLILAVCRETFQLFEYRVDVLDQAAALFLRALHNDLETAAESVRRNELPAATPGKGYSKCWGCGYAKVCDDPGRLEFIN